LIIKALKSRKFHHGKLRGESLVEREKILERQLYETEPYGGVALLAHLYGFLRAPMIERESRAGM
jgi:hypothetical protein